MIKSLIIPADKELEYSLFKLKKSGIDRLEYYITYSEVEKENRDLNWCIYIYYLLFWYNFGTVYSYYVMWLYNQNPAATWF